MQKEFSQQQFVLGWYNDAHLRSQAFHHSSWSHLKLQFSCPHSLAYSSILVSHSFRLHHWSTRTHAIPVTREAIPTHTQIFTTKARESHPTSHPFPAMDGSCPTSQSSPTTTHPILSTPSSHAPPHVQDSVIQRPSSAEFYLRLRWQYC